MKQLYALNHIAALAVIAGAFSLHAPLSAADFTEGAIVLNENQYGKSDSSLNHLDLTTGTWSYGIYSAANGGKAIGGTACSGGYDGTTLYVVCKDKGYPGSDLDGGVVTAMNASDMTMRWQLKQLDPSGQRAAGRGFLAVSESKIYVSSSNGIWVINAADGTVKGMIEGTENPFGVDDKPITDPTSTLYVGQCGTMVKAGGKVFAAHQEKGLLVIDPESDTLLQTISMSSVKTGAGIGSVVLGNDGNLWISIADQTDGYGLPLNLLGKVDPSTCELTTVEIPEGMYGPSQSWAAWNPDTFCASPDGSLYWTGGEDIWYSNMLVYRHDIASGATSLIIDFNDNENGWKVCTPSLRVDPTTGLLYMTLFKDYGSTEYTFRSYTSAGAEVKDYPMKRSYWFCGTILFPAAEMAGIESVASEARAEALSARYSGGVLTLSGFSIGAVNLYDMQGQQVATTNFSESVSSFGIALTPGIYIAAGSNGSVKFVVR